MLAVKTKGKIGKVRYIFKGNNIILTDDSEKRAVQLLSSLSKKMILKLGRAEQKLFGYEKPKISTHTYILCIFSVFSFFCSSDKSPIPIYLLSPTSHSDQ